MASSLMPRTRDLVGTVLDGRYELRRELGHGAFGRVYRGFDRRLARTVAVKVIKPAWSEDPEWVESFEREARLLARLSAPGIVQIFDIGRAPEGLYYVAEYVDGESLARRLERGALRPSDAAPLAEQLCRALGHAHEQRVVHRDVKPANILLSRRGQVKVSDFGIARLAEGTTELDELIVGTPRYMAPEQARGLRATPAVDVYSAGVVLYEMLAGHPPFSGGSAVDLALRHAADRPPPLPEGVPKPLVNVVTRALAKDPAERYPDGTAMARALAGARPRTPKSSEAVDRALRQLDEGLTVSLPREAHPAAGAPSRTLAAPSRAPSRTLTAPPRAPSLRVQSRRRGRRRTLLLAALAIVLVLAGAGSLLAFRLLAPRVVAVPGVVGLERARAAAVLHRAGLLARFSAAYSPAPNGTVIGQQPGRREHVDTGSPVEVRLSAGPRPVEVPRLIGQQSASAQTILASLNLRSSVIAVPAPGTAAGTVTGQRPGSGTYLTPPRAVTLLVAETPVWRAVGSLSGDSTDSSGPVRIRGSRWRLVYQMSYVGTCTFIVFCDGPSATVVDTASGATVASFGLGDGGTRSQVLDTGPGNYEVHVAPGSDTARWSLQIQDYY